MIVKLENYTEFTYKKFNNEYLHYIKNDYEISIVFLWNVFECVIASIYLIFKKVASRVGIYYI